MKQWRRPMLLERTQQWTSQMGFILATSGAAVGLGNIWMFPYVTGMNGGAAFVLVYLLCILLVGLPVMVAETLIGRYGQANAVDSLIRLAHASHASPRWGWLGLWGALALLLILSFYSVVSGWAIAYGVKTAQGLFHHIDAAGVKQIWAGLMGNPWELFFYHTLFMVLTLGVVALGVERGLERASKIMMPGLMLILLFLVAYAVTTGDLKQSVAFLLQPDFSKLTWQGVVTALGLAFFSLALGAGCIVTYASYLKKGESVVKDVLKIAAIDTSVALLAGFAIFPLVFAYQLTPQAGPGLIFEVLPMAFGQMPAGQAVGIAFFVFLIFAVWTSSISLAEPLVAICHERYAVSRVQAVLILGSIAWGLGILVLLSFNAWADVKIAGQTFFDLATGIPNKLILPTGGFLFAIFAGYIVNEKIAQQALCVKSTRIFKAWQFLIRWVAPAAILIVLVAQFKA